MHTVEGDGETEIAYAVHGDAAETVVFLADVGFGPWLWSWQVPQMTGPFRSVVVATRGTNGSDVAGPYSLDRFVTDVETVLADVGARRVHLVGAGLGGMVALEYARRYGRARSLVLLGVPPSGAAIDGEALNRLYPNTDDPMDVEASLSEAFSEEFLAAGKSVDRIVEWRRDEDARDEALEGHRRAFESFESRVLFEIDLSTLVCHGVDDPVVPVDAGRDLAAELPRGRFEAVKGKRLCFVEHSVAVTDAIVGFLEERVEGP